MKTKAFGKTVYIVKAYYNDSAGNLAVKYETWHLKTKAQNDYEDKVKLYGESNVFVFKAKQCLFE